MGVWVLVLEREDNVRYGKKGEVTKAYYDGMEDQLSALGLVLNCIVLWNTVYMDRALAPAARPGLPRAR